MPVYDANGNELTGEALTEAIGSETLTGMVKGHDLYKRTLAETINRREKLKEVKKTVAPEVEDDTEADDTEDEAPAKPVKKPKQPETKQPVLSEDEIIARAAKKVRDELAAEQKAQSDREAMITRIMQENKLKTDDKGYRSILRLAPDEETMKETAATLGKSGNHFDDTPGGDGNGDRDYTGVLSKVDKSLFGENPNK